MSLAASPGGTISDRTPLLFLDINFGNNEISRIVIFEGDQAEIIVEKFAKMHGKLLLLKTVI